MKKNIRNKEYTMEEAVAYFILGYKRCNENNQKRGLEDILKNILEIAKENIDTNEIQGVNTNLLKRINFSWTLTSDDFVSYATCIFYVLINREQKITDEKIVKEFLRELHSHHPRRTMKEAELILTKMFPDLKN